MANLLINAGPGCGKTHTLVDIYYYLKSNSKQNWRKRFRCTDEQEAIYTWCAANLPENPKTVYIAYNTSTRDELTKRIHPETKAATCHGWGYTIIKTKFGYIPLNHKRDEALVEKITGRSYSTLNNRNSWYKAMKYVEKIKEELLPIDMNTLSYLNNKYSDLIKLHPTADMLDLIQQLMQEGRTIEKKVGIPYIDQVYRAISLLPKPIYDLGLVDECQDLSAARLELCKKLCRHLVFCGDKHQAINAFSGADPYAFDKIASICDLSLPLLESFRLPPNHAAEANLIHPTAHIRTTPGKPDGGMYSCTFDELAAKIKPVVGRRPLVICRYNAPLFQAAVELLKNNIPCYVGGSTIQDQLIYFKKGLRPTGLKDLEKKCIAYIEESSSEFDEDTPKGYANEINIDKAKCILSITKLCTELSEFDNALKSMLNEKKGDAAILSTVHRAKGAESKEVFLLFPPMRSGKAKTQEQVEQERNVDFVARTRSMENRTEVWH